MIHAYKTGIELRETLRDGACLRAAMREITLYNIWRLTDLLLKGSVNGGMDYAPVLAAVECVEMVSSALTPPD